MNKGRVTIPTDDNFIKETCEILEKWGADAIRDCDGFKLTPEIEGLAEKIYSTYFVSRGDNKWAEEHMDELQQTYLMSKYNLATSNVLEISIMDGYFEEQIQPDIKNDIKEFWEVIDRTANEVVSTDNWDYNKDEQKVIIKDAKMWHEYNVLFFAYCKWDTTKMYNHITNDLKDKTHDIHFDIRNENTNMHII